MNFLFPRFLHTLQLKKEDIQVDEDVALYIIQSVISDSEKGIRTLERAVKDIIHKISFLVIHDNQLDSSFYCGKKLEYPILLTHSMVDILLKDFKKEDTRYEQMYL
jgi:ATP-dependent Lon protease